VIDYGHLGRSAVATPAKLAQAILQLANAVEPPVRFPLGTDTIKRIAEKNAFVEQETAKWRTLAGYTDY